MHNSCKVQLSASHQACTGHGCIGGVEAAVPEALHKKKEKIRQHSFLCELL